MSILCYLDTKRAVSYPEDFITPEEEVDFIIEMMG